MVHMSAFAITAVTLAATLVSANTDPVCTAPSNTSYNEHDEMSFLQLSASVSHRFTEQPGPKYELFGLQWDHKEPQALRVKIGCNDHDAPIKTGMYHATAPFTHGRLGVLYQIEQAGRKYLVKFPRGPEGLDMEVDVAKALPSWTQMTWKCTGEVLEADTLLAGGGADYTFSVLLKGDIVGFQLDDILMTLAAPTQPFLLHTVKAPETCELGDFNQETYNAVQRAFEPEKENPREALQPVLKTQLTCLFSALMKSCQQSGLAWPDLKPANLIYGKVHNEGPAKLILRDVADIKMWHGDDKEHCLKKFGGSGTGTDEWPKPSCKGPYWSSFYLGDITPESSDGCSI